MKLFSHLFSLVLSFYTSHVHYCDYHSLFLIFIVLGGVAWVLWEIFFFFWLDRTSHFFIDSSIGVALMMMTMIY